MKKVKDDLEEELQRERSAHRHYKRECAALKEEYNNLRLRVHVVLDFCNMHNCSVGPEIFEESNFAAFTVDWQTTKIKSAR